MPPLRIGPVRRLDDAYDEVDAHRAGRVDLVVEGREVVLTLNGLELFPLSLDPYPRETSVLHGCDRLLVECGSRGISPQEYVEAIPDVGTIEVAGRRIGGRHLRVLRGQCFSGRTLLCQILSPEKTEQHLVFRAAILRVIFETSALEILHRVRLPVTGRRRLVLLIELLGYRVSEILKSAVLVPKRLEPIAQGMLRHVEVHVVLRIGERRDRLEWWLSRTRLRQIGAHANELDDIRCTGELRMIFEHGSLEILSIITVLLEDTTDGIPLNIEAAMGLPVLAKKPLDPESGLWEEAWHEQVFRRRRRGANLADRNCEHQDKRD